jgi:hypothetical protein
MSVLPAVSNRFNKWHDPETIQDEMALGYDVMASGHCHQCLKKGYLKHSGYELRG